MPSPTRLRVRHCSGRSVAIEITGLRPGEKLKEQLFDEYEAAAPTPLAKVFRVTPLAADAYVTSADVAHLESVARTMDNALVRQRVFAHLDERVGRQDLAARLVSLEGDERIGAHA